MPLLLFQDVSGLPHQHRYPPRLHPVIPNKCKDHTVFFSLLPINCLRDAKHGMVENEWMDVQAVLYMQL
jgi:hypothetical protein